MTISRRAHRASDGTVILTAHQPSYLPWLGYFHKIALSDVFCYYESVQYQRGDFVTRNRVKTSTGSAIWLTVPVLTGGRLDVAIDELVIDNARRWQRKHWEAIRHGYARAPYYSRYAPRLEPLFARPCTNFADLMHDMLVALLELLGVTVSIVRMREFSFEGTGTARIADMCRQLGADIFLFGAFGRRYAQLPVLERAGVFPYFQSYVHPTYSQPDGAFSSHLSIIDLLFNEGPRSLDVLMSGNVTRQHLLAHRQAWMSASATPGRSTR